MPTNILHAGFRCPSCGRDHAEEAWEFRYGALAGEDYFLGDEVRFEEAFSFFARRLGEPDEQVEVAAEGRCPATGERLEGSIGVVAGVLVSLRVE